MTASGHLSIAGAKQPTETAAFDPLPSPAPGNGRPPVALLLATSAHSGVVTVMRRLAESWLECGVAVDLLHIDGHGPDPSVMPQGVRTMPLECSHVATAGPGLRRYLRAHAPQALLADKHRLNLLALEVARACAVSTRVCIRSGTAVLADLDQYGPWRRLRVRRAIARHYGQAHAVIVPSPGIARDFLELGVPREKLQVIPNPVATAGLDRLAREPLAHPWFQPGEPPVVLGVGELCARKDFLTLLEAACLASRSTALRLMILGDGPERARLEQRACALGWAEHLALPGFVANPYPFMSQAAMLVLPSRLEGFGNVLVEAMHLGTPLIATDCPHGPRDILEHGRLGILVHVGAIRAMAQAIVDTMAKPAKRQDLRAAAARYDKHTNARRYLEVMGVAHAPTMANA